MVYSWALEPHVESQVRKMKVSCAYCTTYHPIVTWPINTTNFLKHTKRRHPGVFANLSPEAMATLTNCEGSIIDTSLGANFSSPQGSIDAYYSSDTSQESPGQMSLLQMSNSQSDKRLKLAVFDPEEYKLLLLDVIISANLPFAFIDSPALQRLLRYLKSNVPSVTQGMLRDLLTDYYVKMSTAFRAILAKNKSRFALTIDEWRASNNLEFFAITIHYFDGNFTLKTDILGFENLNTVSHTGDILFNHLMNVLKEFQVEDRIVSITRDNAGPMNVLMDKFTTECHSRRLPLVEDVRCVGHVFNLATFAFLKWIFFRSTKCTKIDDDIGRVRGEYADQEPLFERMKQLAFLFQSLARGVNFHTYLKNTFDSIVVAEKERQGINSGPDRILRNNSTRWLSTLKMLRRFIHFRKEIEALLGEVYRLPRGRREHYKLREIELCDEDWKYLSFVFDVLQIFEEPTILLQSHKDITVSATVPYVHDLLKQLKRWESHYMARNNALLVRGSKEARLKLLAYYPLGDDADNIPQDIEPIKNLCLASVLDPRLKLRLFEDLGFPDASIMSIKRHVRNVFEGYKSKYSVTVNDDSETESHTEISCAGIAGGRFMPRGVQNNGTGDELSIYLSQERMNFNDPLSQFYHPRKTKFPILSLMARDFLATPAMSAPAESLFSRVNDMVTKKRNKLLPTTIKILAILRHRGQITDGVEAVFDDESYADCVETPEEVSSPEEEVAYITPDHEDEVEEDDFI